MTKTALLKLLLAIVITFILILPEYFKTPKGNMLELSCLEVYLQQNFSYSFFSTNASFVTFLQPIGETQTITGIFLSHSSFQNVTRICQDITSELKTCFSCLACEFKGNTDFIFQEQTSKALIMRGSMQVKSNDFHSPRQHFNFTVTPTADHLEEYNLTCNLKTHTRRSAIEEEDSPEATSVNRTCRTMEHPHNCINISFHLEMDAKNSICSMKITWYVLILLVCIVLLIFIIRKILEGHRRVQKWQSHKYKPTSVLLRGSDSEKLRTLNVRVIPGSHTSFAKVTRKPSRWFRFSTWPALKERGRRGPSPFRAAAPQGHTGSLSRDHQEAADDSGQGRASSNTRTRSYFRGASARSIYTTILLNSSGQFGLNPPEEYS